MREEAGLGAEMVGVMGGGRWVTCAPHRCSSFSRSARGTRVRSATKTYAASPSSGGRAATEGRRPLSHSGEPDSSVTHW